MIILQVSNNESFGKMLLGALYKSTDRLYTYRFYLLFITLVLNFFIPPTFFGQLMRIAFRLFTTTCLSLAGANFIQRDKIHLRNGWFIFGLFIVCVAALTNIYPGKLGIESVQYILMFLFFVVITISLLQQIFSIKEVTSDVILVSFCGYILIGIISFFLFVLIDFSVSDSLSGLSNEFSQRISQIFYFTFTCLTTLGFGDILPLNMISQKLSVFTAAVGQFYIAVVVAILVSRFMQGLDKTKT